MKRPVYRIERAMIERLSAVCVTLLLLIAALGAMAQTTPRQSAARTPQPASPRPTAAHAVKTDRRVYAEPAPPPLPEAGGTFVDPVFGTTLIRVTDQRDGKF